MGMLGPDDPLPAHPRRILVAGVSGAGKTTLAGRIADTLGLPHTELDGLFHGPGWVPREQFVTDVEALAAGEAWVTEWQYRPVRELLAGRAELMVWLDLPRRTVMRRVTNRTLRRRLGRQELWNGNLEPPLRTFFTDPDHIVRWAWKQHGRHRSKVLALAERHPALPIVRLRSSRETERWLARGLGLPWRGPAGEGA
jgi:adenylate kinase family enzyme